jgi:hypothetical protein
MLDYTDLTSAQRSNIPSGQTSCRSMHSIWTLDIGRETIGNKTLQRRANVEPISRANVDTMSKMTTGQRWHSTSNQRQRRPLTDVGPTSLCRRGSASINLFLLIFRIVITSESQNELWQIMHLSQFTSFRLLLGIDGQSFTGLWNWAISGLITYPAGLVRVLETHELNKF